MFFDFEFVADDKTSGLIFFAAALGELLHVAFTPFILEDVAVVVVVSGCTLVLSSPLVEDSSFRCENHSSSSTSPACLEVWSSCSCTLLVVFAAGAADVV